VQGGKMAVDINVPNSFKYRVFQHSDKIYSKVLSHTGSGFNNHKFYILQILQEIASPTSFFFFTRWGRVGMPGQTALMGPLDATQAIQRF
jgi:poly [ADP-ribose] polymerase 2/3/4